MKSCSFEPVTWFASGWDKINLLRGFTFYWQTGNAAHAIHSLPTVGVKHFFCPTFGDHARHLIYMMALQEQGVSCSRLKQERAQETGELSFVGLCRPEIQEEEETWEEWAGAGKRTDQIWIALEMDMDCVSLSYLIFVSHSSITAWVNIFQLSVKRIQMNAKNTAFLVNIYWTNSQTQAKLRTWSRIRC